MYHLCVVVIANIGQGNRGNEWDQNNTLGWDNPGANHVTPESSIHSGEY